jgi:hypothetical protein
VSGDLSAVLGGSGNTIQSLSTNSFLGGGYANVIQSDSPYSTIGGGYANVIQTNSRSSTISGGDQNTIQAQIGFVGGGWLNQILSAGYIGSIGGGFSNQVGGQYAAISGGYQNSATANYSFIGGGTNNLAGGNAATVPGGSENMAMGSYSLAAGQQAQALHQGAFVWADSQNAAFASTSNDQFLVRAQGGLGINTNNPQGAALNVNGAIVASGTVTANGVLLTSDRSAKENFAALDSQTVLAKVTALPLTEWNYKDGPAGVRHVGPMAQDFHAAFQLNGNDDKHISVVDESGVALAAIQGLNQKIAERDAEIQELKQRLDRLEKMLSR